MNLEQRIERLETIEAIKQLKAIYFHSCDRKDVESIRSCFSSSRVDIDYGVVGTFQKLDDFISMFQEKACHSHIIDIHHGQNPQFLEISESHVVAKWDLFFQQIDKERSVLTQLAGYYDDEFVKEEGNWKIAKTRFNVTSSFVTNFSEDQIRLVFAGN